MNTKLNKPELMGQIMEILEAVSEDPAEKLIAMGEAFVKVGTCLKGVPLTEARNVIRAVALMQGFELN